MPETPDFEKIAADWFSEDNGMEDPIHGFSEFAASPSVMRQRFVEQLRQIWNARGAADIAKIDHELTSMMGGQAAGPYVKNLDRALRGLDR